MPQPPKQKTASSASLLYGIHKQNKPTASNPSSSSSPSSQKGSDSSSKVGSASNLAFTSTLSSLIQSSASTPTTTTKAKPRSSRDKGKDDIFTTHNRNTAKRAAADEEYRQSQQHKRSADIGGDVDAATLARSRRKMEEKVRVYEELKKGGYLLDGGSDSEDEIGPARGSDAVAATEGEKYLSRLRRKEREGLVDFDRKWAEEEGDLSGSDDDDDNDDGARSEAGHDNDVLVEYEDEFGRTRRGTRAEAARAVAARKQSSGGNEDVTAGDRSRPARPSNLIYGEAIQSEAFQPDELAAAQMSFLASKRDRSPTPPEATHYDADAEVRNRGTGFYAFSRDEALREKEMAELKNARNETEQIRKMRLERKKEREKVKEERRRQIKELRAKHHADRFLQGLGSGLGVEGLS